MSASDNSAAVMPFAQRQVNKPIFNLILWVELNTDEKPPAAQTALGIDPKTFRMSEITQTQSATTSVPTQLVQCAILHSSVFSACPLIDGATVPKLPTKNELLPCFCIFRICRPDRRLMRNHILHLVTVKIKRLKQPDNFSNTFMHSLLSICIIFQAK